MNKISLSRGKCTKRYSFSHSAVESPAVFFSFFFFSTSLSLSCARSIEDETERPFFSEFLSEARHEPSGDSEARLGSPSPPGVRSERSHQDLRPSLRDGNRSSPVLRRGSTSAVRAVRCVLATARFFRILTSSLVLVFLNGVSRCASCIAEVGSRRRGGKKLRLVTTSGLVICSYSFVLLWRRLALLG